MSLSPPPKSPPTIDRQTTTPFLLNFCYRQSAFHNLTDFPIATPSNPHPHLPAHLQIYTWMSCTLRELAHLLTTALPNIVPDPAIGTRLAFRLIYPDLSAGRVGMGRGGGGLDREGRLDGEQGRGRYISREMGSVVISIPDGYRNGNDESSGKGYELGGEDAGKTLEDIRFVIGDFVDCAVFPPLSDGSVVSRGSVSGGGMGMRGSVSGRRENGFGGGSGGAGGRGRGGGYGMGGGGGGGGRSRGEFGGSTIPSGEWRRGERLPDSGGGGFRGGGSSGGGGYGGSGGGGRGRPRPY